MFKDQESNQNMRAIKHSKQQSINNTRQLKGDLNSSNYDLSERSSIMQNVNFDPKLFAANDKSHSNNN